MKVLIDIKEAKVPFVMELLQNLSFVKTKPLSPYKAKVLEDLKEAVEEMKLVKAGKLKTRNAEDYFMRFKVKSIPKFERELKRLAKKYPSVKEEYLQFIHSLIIKPAQGTALGNNCYKIRLSIASKGKVEVQE